jgi:hypothetical protein
VRIFLGGLLAAGLHDAVTGTDVVEPEVAVGMNDLVAQPSRHDEGAGGDSRSGWSGRNRGDMANVAADVVEQACAGYAVRRSGKRGVARPHFCGAH